MDLFSTTFFWLVTVLLIYHHQRWATFDPFHPEYDGGQAWTLLFSVIVAAGFFYAMGALAAGENKMAAFVAWLCMGSMIGALTIGGIKYTPEEFPDPTERWIEERKEWARSVAFGIVVVGAINGLLSLLPWHPPSHTVVFAISLLLGLGRFGKARELNGTAKLGPIYDKPGVARQVARRAIRGVLALCVLYVLAYPLLSQIEPLSFDEKLTIAGLVLGGILAFILG